MARLDDLIGQVGDARLRQELGAALAGLKKRQQFGIVFEEHVPETKAFPGLPIHVGSLVYRRDDSEARPWKVTEMTPHGRNATIVPEAGGEAESVLTNGLLVAKRFGEPVYPTLRPVGRVQRGGDKPFHAIVNGENFHALQLLMFQFEGQVDCIYIDPPYNTGARDWKYNNRYVDKTDAWRHSKWLSMMDKRLRLAKRLLKPNGVLICTIDEHEVHHLGMLLESIFPGYLHYMVSIVINPKGRDKANFAPVDEFAFFVVPNVGRDVILRSPTGPPGRQTTIEMAGTVEVGEDVVPVAEQDQADEGNDEGDGDEEAEDDAAADDEWEWRHARRRGGGAEMSSYREKRPDQFYPIFIDEKARKVVRAGEPIPRDQQPTFKKVGGLRPLWPIDAAGRHRCWAFVPTSMQRMIDGGHVALGKYHVERDDWTLKYRVPRKNTRKLKTVWWEKPHDAGTHGTELLKKLLGQPGLFPFPKSVYAVKDCLAAVVRDRPEALILDFFAGSGTTFHATALLNAEDGGRRRTILVSNNEVGEKRAKALREEGHHPGDVAYEREGIFESVTRPRCTAVVTGKTPAGNPIEGRHLDAKGLPRGRPFADGFPENVEFFDITYLDPDEVDVGGQFAAISPLLWLGAGATGEREDEAPSTGKHYSMPEGAGYAVLFKEGRFERFREALDKRPDVSRVWLVTDSDSAYSHMRATLPRRLRAGMLYRDYLRTFAINTGRTHQ